MNNRLGIKLALIVMLVAVAVGLAAGKQTAAQTSTGATIRASIDSSLPVISADGRFVAFYSSNPDLVPDDTNGRYDTFIYDQQTGTTSRVSIDSTGAQTEGDFVIAYTSPAISADGRIVAFESEATTLTPGGIVGHHIFVHDRQTGATSRVSVNSNGFPANNSSDYPAISANGRFVAFSSYASNLAPGDAYGSDIFVHDRQGGTTVVSVSSAGTGGNGYSRSPAISADGRFVAFSSAAFNLVPDDANMSYDIFVHDRQTGATTRVSVSSTGVPANSSSDYPAISANGRFIAFTSYASNLVFGDTNGTRDIFVHDRLTGTTRRVSVASNGEQAQGDNSWTRPAISADGRYVAFMSRAPNLVAGDTNGKEDVFVYDLQTGQTSRASHHTNGSQGNAVSNNPSLSADGRFVAFDSEATNLVNSDTNDKKDVFIHDRGSGSGSVLGETTVMPFLAIPFSLSAGEGDPLQNWNRGRINSWFDHTNPNWGQKDGSLRLYDPAFDVSVHQGDIAGLPCYAASKTAPRYCYESHDGIDFKPSINGGANQPVLAAASGEVADTIENCCAGLGNNVILYHFQGYFTRYGHLKDIKVNKGQPVNSGDQIGTMGNTGNSSGVHLHFSVYLVV